MTPYATLKRSFLSLNKRQLGNLKWHLERRTRILCGREATTWVWQGAGRPAVLASIRSDPKELPCSDLRNETSLYPAWDKLCAVSAMSYMRALSGATEPIVRRAIRAALRERGMQA